LIKTKLYYSWVVFNVIIWTITLGTLGVLGSIFEWRGRYMGWIVRLWAKIILKASFIEFKIEGEENIKPDTHYFFAANHESEFDIPLVFAAIKLQMVAISKIELKNIPFLGWAMQAAGHIFVNRKNHVSALKSMEKARESMSQNPRSVIIFPEGTRSKDGQILPFKKGGLILAMNLKMEVVPLGIIGTRTFIQNKFSSRNQTLKLIIGKPIKTSSINYADRNIFVKNVRSEVVKLVRV
jgi:1-acyl-sn-glycerol-3-phosphate acyltransferase